MTSEEIAEYKDQVFSGNQTQQALAPINAIVEPAKPDPIVPVANVSSDGLTNNATPSDDQNPNIEPNLANEKVVDSNEYLKQELGYDSWEVAKSELAELKKLKESPQFNDTSKRFLEYLKEGKEDDVYNLLHEKRQLDKLTKVEVTKDIADEIIKLEMQQQFKNLTSEEINHQFRKQYSVPKAPIQGSLEDDEDFEARKEEWKEQVKDIEMSKVIAAKIAQPKLAALKSELSLPEIKSPGDESYQAFVENSKRANEDYQKLSEGLSKMTEKDVAFKLEFSDEASKLKFDADFSADKDGFEKARQAALNYMEHISTSYYTKDGSPLLNKLVQDIYISQNRDKVLSTFMNIAANAERVRFLANQKNIGDGSQRQYQQVEQGEVDKLRQQLFPK